MTVYTDVCHACLMSTRKQQTAPAKDAAVSTDQQRADRAERIDARIQRLGITKQELADKAGIDRGTLGRALKADPRIADRTWVRIENVLTGIENDLGIGVQLASTASGEVVTGSIKYAGAEITLSGQADAVAEAIRRVLGED